MADIKISQLPTLSAADADWQNDNLPIVDISAVSTKKITPSNLVSSVLSNNRQFSITIDGNINANQVTVDEIITSTGIIPTITATTNLNFNVSGRIDIISGALTLSKFTNSDRDLIPAVNGTIIFNTTDSTVQVFNNSSWVTLSVPQNNIANITSSSTITPNADQAQQLNITALAENCTLNAPIGSPRNGQKLIIRIKDDGSNRLLTWNSAYRQIGVSLPSSTVAGKVSYVGCLYNQQDSLWDVIAVKTQV